VYVDVILTRSKVKVKVTGLLNFRQLAKLYMLAAMAAVPPCGAFWFSVVLALQFSLSEFDLSLVIPHITPNVFII